MIRAVEGGDDTRGGNEFMLIKTLLRFLACVCLTTIALATPPKPGKYAGSVTFMETMTALGLKTTRTVKVVARLDADGNLSILAPTGTDLTDLMALGTGLDRNYSIHSVTTAPDAVDGDANSKVTATSIRFTKLLPAVTKPNGGTMVDTAFDLSVAVKLVRTGN